MLFRSSPANQRNTVDNLADQSNIVENRQPVQRVDDVPVSYTHLDVYKRQYVHSIK